MNYVSNDFGILAAPIRFNHSGIVGDCNTKKRRLLFCIQVAAKEGGECWTEPWLEAKAVLRGWGHRVASAQAKLSLPL